MEFRKVEQVRDEVVGILPVYSEVGNVTEVMLRSAADIVMIVKYRLFY